MNYKYLFKIRSNKRGDLFTLLTMTPPTREFVKAEMERQRDMGGGHDPYKVAEAIGVLRDAYHFPHLGSPDQNHEYVYREEERFWLTLRPLES